MAEREPMIDPVQDARSMALYALINLEIASADGLPNSPGITPWHIGAFLRSELKLLEVTDSVDDNPVRLKLCQAAQDLETSSGMLAARFYLSLRRDDFRAAANESPTEAQGRGLQSEVDALNKALEVQFR